MQRRCSVTKNQVFFASLPTPFPLSNFVCFHRNICLQAEQTQRLLMTFLDQISMSKIIRLKSLFDKILHSLMFSSRSKIIFSDQYNYVLCIGSRFIQWLYRFGAILQFTVNTERIFTLQFYISPKIMYCLLVTKKKDAVNSETFGFILKNRKKCGYIRSI